MTAVVQVRSVYGKQTVYPINREAKLFAQIAGTKTITLETLELMNTLGVNIEIKPEFDPFGIAAKC